MVVWMDPLSSPLPSLPQTSIKINKTRDTIRVFYGRFSSRSQKNANDAEAAVSPAGFGPGVAGVTLPLLFLPGLPAQASCSRFGQGWVGLGITQLP